jgi:hypothetical protein
LQSGDSAYSADPAEYDTGAHPPVFSSIHAWLVSNYRVGQSQGQLAESWQRSPDFKVWTFTFRPNLTFENGDPIGPRDLADSWLRLIRILKNKGSVPGFLAELEGYQAYPQKTASISGISYDSKTLTLRFLKPMPKLLDQAAFGTYALVHRSCVDPKTGRWLDRKHTVASGPYRIAEWDGQHLLMVLRPEFPAELRHPRPLNRILVRWDPESSQDDAKKGTDLILASNNAPLASWHYKYYGGAASGIYYLRTQSWQDPRSPLANRALRRHIRLAFYEELEKRAIHPAKSFFPLRFKGVRELSAALSPEDAATPIPAKAGIRYAMTDTKEPLDDKGLALKAAVERLGLVFSSVSVPLETQVEEHKSVKARFQDDLAPFGTGIDLDDPDNDIRFMIQTKEGIYLPDPTGRLAKAIKSSPINMQKVNEILWDDAIVWPWAHVSQGLWTRPEFDLSLVNVLLPATPLYLIGWGS